MKTTIRSIILLSLSMALLLSLVPAAQAYSYYDNYPQYVVESYSPNGYCYQYDKPSSVTGRNLGRHNNGEIVKVIDWYASDEYCYTICSNGKVGYIRKNQLTPRYSAEDRNLWRIYSVQPNGYCYMYDQPSSVTGVNLGRYNNGDYVEMIDFYADENYAKVCGVSTGTYGFIRKDCLVYEEDYKPVQFYVYVNSTDPYGYCYQYDKPSSISGQNLGRHDNGERVGVIDWYADDVYALVECQNGKVGYIRKTCLSY